ncbi:MAG TPA: type II toxin-antitoxin system Phd/YefM family antitoxin [Chloroflexota bacterium]|nr:type II toxin-antitoxin system Phd/YefM family antitoxin [Chloroflexota bacterium]
MVSEDRVGLREFNEHTSRYVHHVRESGRMLEITYHGRTVARLVPPDSDKREQLSPQQWLAGMEAFSQELAEKWPKDVSAVDVIREERADP